MPKYTLADAVKRHEENPDTFQIPSWADITSIREGHFVKVGIEFQQRGHAECERMWIIVAKIVTDGKDFTFTGTLTNHPIMKGHGLEYGREVTFGTRNIFGIMKP